MGDSIPNITAIRTIPLQEEREGARRDTFTNEQTLVEVRTDAGLVGYGSCYTATALANAAIGLVKDLLIGEIAIEPERIHEKLEQKNFWRGRGGTVTHAISGIDIALWDIFGQATGQPVGRLLGGIYRGKVKPYASLSMGDPDTLKERLEAALERGFRAFKLGWGLFGRRGDPSYDERLVRMARDTIGDAELMIDPGGSQEFWPHGYKWALETAKMLAEYDVVWLEEALPPDDIEGYKLLRAHSPVRIASGEVLTRRQSFLPWLEGAALDIIQPDPTKVGGLTEARHIAWLAYNHNILTVPHGWNTALGLAADSHLVSALPVGKWVEYHQPSAYIDEMVAKPFVLDEEGMLAVPSGPGLGVELDWDGIARLSRGLGEA